MCVCVSSNAFQILISKTSLLTYKDLKWNDVNSSLVIFKTSLKKNIFLMKHYKIISHCLKFGDLI
jgi:hypothetical protein